MSEKKYTKWEALGVIADYVLAVSDWERPVICEPNKAALEAMRKMHTELMKLPRGAVITVEVTE